jgi:hypothetical protein
MYNQLPSTVLRDASTFDMMVADVYTTWERHKANPDKTEYSDDQLKDFMNGVRNQ